VSNGCNLTDGGFTTVEFNHISKGFGFQDFTKNKPTNQTQPKQPLHLTMSKSLILLTAAASIGVSHAIDCVDYGGNPSAPLTADVVLVAGKTNDLKNCTADTAGYPYPTAPCISTCPAGPSSCFNQYLKGKNVAGGCVPTASCTSGMTTDGGAQLCCATKLCNDNLKAVKSASTTLSVATLAAASFGIVAALLM